MLNQSPFMYSMYSMLLLSTFMTMLSPNWMMAWIMLELNMLSFIPVMMKSKSNQETEASIKYFLSQAMGSMIMLLSMSMMNKLGAQEVYKIMIMLSMMIKLGVAPCHFWYPSVMLSISWGNCLILSTWQKLAPLSLLMTISYQSISSSVLMLVAGINALIGGIMGINQTHLRPLLAYSSIGHMGWMVSMLSINKIIQCSSYFIMYSIIVIPVFLSLMSSNPKSIKSMYNSFKDSLTKSAMVIISLLSLAGIPPLSGFMPKLMVMFSMADSKFLIALVPLIIGSYMNLYYYLNIALNMIMMNSMSFYSMKSDKALTPVFIMGTSMLGIFPLMLL